MIGAGRGKGAVAAPDPRSVCLSDRDSAIACNCGQPTETQRE
jgi:hypothetical protein